MMKKLIGNKARLAVLLAFFTNGALVATWVSRIPVVQTKLGLSDGALGLVLIGFSGGLLSALFLVGGLIGRYGSHKVTLACGLASCLALPFLVVSTHPVMLFIVLFLFGGGISSMDVAINEQAVLVERNAGKPQMSSFHASYSIGGFAGALISAGMAAIPGSSALIHFLIVSLLFGVMIIFMFPHLIRTEHEVGKKEAVFRLPERALWILGAVAFCSAIGEGAMADWGAVYLTQVLRTDAAFAALGFAAFSLTMTFGRLIGDFLSSKWSSAVIVRAGGLFAAFGILLAAVTKSPLVAMAGYSVAGFGLANIIPLLFGAAGNIPGIQAGAGIAGVATIGYAGFLAGPPLIGSIAEATSLRVALALVAVLVGTLVFSAKAISPKSKTG
jgi:predicted MFS family arabinose efflux permease